MEINEDVWILTMCGRCYANCGVKVRRVNGVAVQIEGRPDSDMGHGVVCVPKVLQDFRYYTILIG